MEQLIHLDQHLLLLLNGSSSLFLDHLVMTLTNGLTWIPLYVALLYTVIRTEADARRVLFVLAAAGLCVMLAGTLNDTFVKPVVARWRPARDPFIGPLVDTAFGYRGGRFGFFSSHAANTFSVAFFFSLLLRRQIATVTLIAWSLLNCWTRLYLGVHYPGDILVGLLWGSVVGYSVYWIFSLLQQKTGFAPIRYHAHHCLVPAAVFVATIVCSVVMAAIAM